MLQTLFEPFAAYKQNLQIFMSVSKAFLNGTFVNAQIYIESKYFFHLKLFVLTNWLVQVNGSGEGTGTVSDFSEFRNVFYPNYDSEYDNSDLVFSNISSSTREKVC